MNPPSPSLRVLVVDDNQDAADSLAYLLQRYNYEARVAYDGRAGLQAARASAPDCLISDIGMPGLDGYALARAVRADPSLAKVTLVALSAYSGEEHNRKAVEAGFEYRVTKGSDPAELLEVLRMIEQIKNLATKTQELAKENLDLAGQTRDLLKEVKEDVREVKQEVKELKQEVKDLREKQDGEPNGSGEEPTNPGSAAPGG